MKIIQGNRQSGKTTELIKMSSRENKHIVCNYADEKIRIGRMAKRMGMEIPKVILPHELPLKGMRVESVLVDNVECVLEQLLGAKVDYVTTSCEVHKIVLPK